MSVQVALNGRKICVRCPPGLNPAIHEIGGASWHKKWDCWVFPYSERMAYDILKPLKPHITGCDRQLIEAAKVYVAALAARTSTVMPDIQNVTRTPWTHQGQGYAFAWGLSGVALTMDMGTGKTFTTISTMVNRKCDVNIILTPKKVVPVWPRELQETTNIPFEVYACNENHDVPRKTKEGKLALERAQAYEKPFIFVVNYESAFREPMGEWLLSLPIDNLILDEVHKAKQHDGKIGRFCAKLGDRALFKLGLSGTIMPNGPLDLFSIYRILDKGIFGENIMAFKAKYIKYGGFNAKEIVGYKNMEDFHRRYDSISFRVTKDVLSLPDAIHTRLFCTLTKEARRVYDNLNKELYAEIDNDTITASTALVRLLRMQQLTGGYVRIDNKEVGDKSVVYKEISTSKRELFAELLEDIPQDEPVVAFCRFTHDIQVIREEAEKAGRGYFEVSGRISEWEAFQAAKGGQVIAVQISAGGVGISLTRAQYCVYYSTGYSLGDFDQSLSRTHRPGQKRTVFYYHLLAEQTTDMDVYEALENKKEVIEYVINKIKENRHGCKSCSPD